ncbi:hypothetical protein VTO73DRAFT_12423 [Trametes versicolor]
MPRPTKEQIRKDIEDAATVNLLVSFIFDSDESDQPEDPDILNSEDEFDGEWQDQDFTVAELLELSAVNWLAIAEEFNDHDQRGPYNQILRSKDFFSCCLQASDRDFRHMFRMGRDTFDRLVALLAQNPIFTSKGKRPQRHVKFQLGTFLFRYGSRGSDSLWVAEKLGIGFGTVFKYCRRVCRAIRELRDRFLGWMTPDRRDTVSAYIQHGYGFRNGVGCGDGSFVPFGDQPDIIGAAFKSRKKFFGTNVQATCDHEGRITSYETAWPGSVPDVKIWKNSRIWRKPHDYFREGEYILVDKGYPSSPYVLRPFSEPEVAAASAQDRQRMREFNARISSIRIASEHTFGRLKGRFTSLKCMGPHDDLDDLYKAIEALMILHNICIEWKDKPEYIWSFDPRDNTPAHFKDDVDPDVIVQVVAGETEIPALYLMNYSQ